MVGPSILLGPSIKDRLFTRFASRRRTPDARVRWPLAPREEKRSFSLLVVLVSCLTSHFRLIVDL